jgi:hypothetical protein
VIEFSSISLEGGEWVSMPLLGLIRSTLDAGLMKPRRGFTLIAGKEKLAGSKRVF